MQSLNNYLLDNVKEQGVVDLIFQYKSQLDHYERMKTLKDEILDDNFDRAVYTEEDSDLEINVPETLRVYKEMIPDCGIEFDFAVERTADKSLIDGKWFTSTYVFNVRGKYGRITLIDGECCNSSDSSDSLSEDRMNEILFCTENVGMFAGFLQMCLNFEDGLDD